MPVHNPGAEHKVGVLMGSPNDRAKMRPAVKKLAEFGFEVHELPLSAHRAAEETTAFCRKAGDNDFAAIIAGAGMSAALPGACAAATVVPVVGVPLSGGGAVNELAAVLAIEALPPGIAAATMALDGSLNAALFVASMVARYDADMLDRVILDREKRKAEKSVFKLEDGDPELIKRGKVRDIYRVEGCPGELFFHTTDRLSAFDVVSDQLLPGKGRVLNALTEHWLLNTPVGQGVEHHLLPLGNVTSQLSGPAFAGTVQRVRDLGEYLLPIECIVRGYLLGSAWKEYQKSGTMHGQPLPEGMVQAQKLPEPVFTPSTKAEEGEHDENISFEAAVALLERHHYTDPRGLAERIRDFCIERYELGRDYAAARGILIFDTKFELALVDGELVLVDEVLTPDSSRFALADGFKEGEAPKSLDKEAIRSWLKKNHPEWVANPTSPMPELHPSVIAETMGKYELMLQLLTGPPVAA